MDAAAKFEKRRESLGRVRLDVRLSPDEPPRRMTALQALALAGSLQQQRRHDLAWNVCEQLIADGRAVTEAALVKLAVAMDAGRPRTALEIAQPLIDAEILDPTGIGILANALRFCNRHEDAGRILDDAIRRFPDSPDLLERHAIRLLDINETERGVEELRGVLRLDPSRTKVYLNISMFDRLTAGELGALRRIDAHGSRLADVHFCLANHCRRDGDIDGEFRHLDAAHAAARGTMPPWDAGKRSAELTEMIRLLDDTHFSALDQPACRNERPLFIVGMPRSGSTLAESILVSVPGVGTAGEAILFEAAFVDQAMRAGLSGDWPQVMAGMRNKDLMAIAGDYIAGIRSIYSDRRIFVDKKLGNYAFIGMIAPAFHEARFVHVVRHPLDAILSCYQQSFVSVPFAHSLEDLAKSYLDQQRAMAHWKQLFPGRVHTLEYEVLVGDTETTSRALLGFCGLEWTPDVLEFYRADRVVLTASVGQVRRPVYGSSAGRWKRYAKHLEPARRLLGL